jgi:hypothetical protein
VWLEEYYKRGVAGGIFIRGCGRRREGCGWRNIIRDRGI